MKQYIHPFSLLTNLFLSGDKKAELPVIELFTDYNSDNIQYHKVSVSLSEATKMVFWCKSLI